MYYIVSYEEYRIKKYHSTLLEQSLKVSTLDSAKYKALRLSSAGVQYVVTDRNRNKIAVYKGGMRVSG